MFSVADFLDRAKANAGLTSDYQLAKAIHVNPQNISSYRNNKTMPDEITLVLLCELSGDDAALVAAEIQALRCKTDAARDLWHAIAARLAQVPVHAVAGILLPVFVAISFIAGEPDMARASDDVTFSSPSISSVYYVKWPAGEYSQGPTLLFSILGLLALFRIRRSIWR